MNEENNKRKSFAVSLAVAVGFCTLGMVSLALGLTNLGTAFFFFLPLGIGISSGILPNPGHAILGVLAGLVLFSLALLVTKAEGIVCVLMATPILLLAVGLGYGIGQLIKKSQKKNNGKGKARMTVAPIMLFLAASFFEIFSGNKMIPASVSTSVTLNATPVEVYDAIIAVDTVDVETNFLQKIGLPTPRKCTLTEEKIGGLRICAFEEGEIIETITAFEKGKLLRMDVTSCDLGKERSWLKFDEDIYTITPVESGTSVITRTTTYHSNLKPRWYWEYMESLTIESEQDFVFRNLKKDLARQ